MLPHRVTARSIILTLGLLAMSSAVARTADAQQAAPERLFTQAQADRGHDVYRAPPTVFVFALADR